MPNQFLFERLLGIHATLMSVYFAGAAMSAASKGEERQAFIGSFLANVLPPTFRFGSGDATDSIGHRSGQLDVVVEYPFMPSLPSLGGTRLYLAESVAGVVEVKSDVAAQWGEALRTADQLAPLQRRFSSIVSVGGGQLEHIPLFVAGYTGWRTLETVQRNLAQRPDIAGILVMDQGIFASSENFRSIAIEESGPWALWGLIACLHQATNWLKMASPDPMDYVRPAEKAR